GGGAVGQLERPTRWRPLGEDVRLPVHVGDAERGELALQQGDVRVVRRAARRPEPAVELIDLGLPLLERCARRAVRRRAAPRSARAGGSARARVPSRARGGHARRTAPTARHDKTGKNGGRDEGHPHASWDMYHLTHHGRPPEESVETTDLCIKQAAGTTRM